MTLQELKEGTLVTDKEKPTHGIGKVDRTKDGITYVWYDEIENMVHYTEDELMFLEPLEN